MEPRRSPTMSSALTTLLSCGLKIETVIDIGVLTGTGYLIRSFPDAFHHLFEPLTLYSDQIDANYRLVNHKLHHVAVSSEPGMAFQVGTSIDDSGKATHSFLSDTPIDAGAEYNGARVSECKSITKVTLDSHFLGEELPEHYLVKIDVDGHELPIISGGQTVLGGSDVVIVEATLNTLIERGAAIQALGFQLIDVVDLCYYHHTLHQVDLVFASRRSLESMPDLRPWSTKQFATDAWSEFSKQLCELPVG